MHRNEARIHSLWLIANVQERDAERKFSRMLEIATATLRPDKPMLGTLSYLDRGNIVYEAVAWCGATQPANALPALVPGLAVPLSQTIQTFMYADGSAHAWNDLANSEAVGLEIPTKLGARSMVGSAIQVGGRTHFLTYTCQVSMLDDPFEQRDLDYVNVIGKLFAGAYSNRDASERLRHHIEHDALTGLVNQVQFRKAIREEFDRAVPFAIAVVNIDRFRQVNEIHGSLIADEVLVEVAADLDAIAENDLVARLNGDEFGIITRGITSSDHFKATIERYKALFSTPFHTGDRDGSRMISLDASFGWVEASGDRTSTPEHLLRRADVALEIAKERGGRSAMIFTESMERILEQRLTAANDIDKAILNDEFQLAYQPTFDLASGAITGAEALIRWHHPHHGLVMPGDFIAAAERNGRMSAISRWVLARVVRDLTSAPLPPIFRCYFNLSALDLDDFAFISAFTDAIAETPSVAARLGVEITETTAMHNVEQSTATLGLIRSLGIKVAIDDFGTGYSSLSYLKRLAVDVVKIDRSFVTGLPDDAQDAALTESMIDICSRLHLPVLAEGIETEAQRAWLLAHGCTSGQGYLVSKPIPFEKLIGRLSTANIIDIASLARSEGEESWPSQPA